MKVPRKAAYISSTKPRTCAPVWSCGAKTTFPAALVPFLQLFLDVFHTFRVLLWLRVELRTSQTHANFAIRVPNAAHRNDDEHKERCTQRCSKAKLPAEIIRIHVSRIRARRKAKCKEGSYSRKAKQFERNCGLFSSLSWQRVCTMMVC